MGVRTSLLRGLTKNVHGLYKSLHQLKHSIHCSQNAYILYISYRIYNQPIQSCVRTTTDDPVQRKRVYNLQPVYISSLLHANIWSSQYGEWMDGVIRENLGLEIRPKWTKEDTVIAVSDGV